MAVVVFDPTAWAAAFPEFADLGPVVAQGYFDLATLVLSNADNSPVQNVAKRTNLLNLLTAHIATLWARNAQGGQQGGLVGRINTATQGSVSVGAEMPANPNASWFNQTTYGALYWQATAQYRTMRYVPPIPYSFGPIPWARPWRR